MIDLIPPDSTKNNSKYLSQFILFALSSTHLNSKYFYPSNGKITLLLSRSLSPLLPSPSPSPLPFPLSLPSTSSQYCITMSLNCLRCHNLGRTVSEKEHIEGYGDKKPHFKSRWPKVDRSWSGNLAPRPYEKIRREPTSNTMASHGKIAAESGGGHWSTTHRSGPIRLDNGPRLARSCGMRRDWSFEDLRQRVDEKIQGH